MVVLAEAWKSYCGVQHVAREPQVADPQLYSQTWDAAENLRLERFYVHLPCCARAPNCTPHTRAMRKYPQQSMSAAPAPLSLQVPLNVWRKAARAVHTFLLIRGQEAEIGALLTEDQSVSSARDERAAAGQGCGAHLFL